MLKHYNVLSSVLKFRLFHLCFGASCVQVQLRADSKCARRLVWSNGVEVRVSCGVGHKQHWCGCRCGARA